LGKQTRLKKQGIDIHCLAFFLAGEVCFLNAFKVLIFSQL